MNPLLKRILDRFLSFGPVKLLLALRLPGLHGIPLSEVLGSLIRSLLSSRISMRAAAVSFDFFMALFPSVIFLFTLTAYLPIANFDKLLLETIRDVLPDYTYKTIESTITDIISIQRGGLLSVGFIIALFYATNGTTSLIKSFNALSFVQDSRPGWLIRLNALLLTLIFVVLLVSAIILIIFTHYMLEYLIHQGIISNDINLTLVSVGERVTLLLMILFSICALYFFGPSPSIRPHFFSPGAIMATLLIVLLIEGFGIFINRFATFNTVYGSVGALIAVLLLINLNALIILAGHEFNAVVNQLKNQKRS
jgi:membrane protein